MEKSKNQKIQLGIFVIIGLVILILSIYYIGNKQNIFGKTVHISSLFNNVNGLQLGNNIRYSGINVGTVKGINMIDDTIISVDMAIQENIIAHLKKDAIATITTDGLVGNMIINILPGKGLEPSVQAGDIIKSYSRIGTDEILNTLNVTNENAAILTADLVKITKEIINGKGVIGALIRDSTITVDLKQTLTFLKNTSYESSVAIKNINTFITSLDNKENLVGLLKDPIIAQQIRTVMNNIEISTNDMSTVISNLNLTILAANSAVQNIKDGKGAINYLSNDPEPVRKIDFILSNMDSTMIQINAAGIRLNENLEALKHNFLLRGYFKNLEKEKAKKMKK